MQLSEKIWSWEIPKYSVWSYSKQTFSIISYIAILQPAVHQCSLARSPPAPSISQWHPDSLRFQHVLLWHGCVILAALSVPLNRPPGPTLEEVQSLKQINKTSCKVSTEFHIFLCHFFFCKMTAEYIYKDILDALVNYFQSHFIFSIMLDSCLKVDFMHKRGRSWKVKIMKL